MRLRGMFYGVIISHSSINIINIRQKRKAKEFQVSCIGQGPREHLIHRVSPRPKKSEAAGPLRGQEDEPDR